MRRRPNEARRRRGQRRVWSGALAGVIVSGATGCMYPLRAQELVAVPAADGGRINADLYGNGDRGVVLDAHGGYSFKARWEPQARMLADSGFRVVVIDIRAGDSLRAGRETACLYDAVCMSADVLAAVRYLRQAGAKSVSVVGGSAGGGAAAQASVGAASGEIERVVLLAPMSIAAPEKIKGRKLFVVSRDDLGSDDKPRLPAIRAQYGRASDPKELIVLDGSAHAQRIFDTPEGAALMRELLRFLRAP